MTSVAGLVNPSKNSIYGDQLLVYYVNNNNNLALKIISLGAPDGQQDIYTTYNANVKGYLKNPCSLAVVPVKNIIGIYGVIVTSTGTTSRGEIALLSPVLQPLGIQCEATYGRIASAADLDHGQAWIYYRKLGTTAGTTVPGLTIYQVSLTSVLPTLDEVAVYTAGSNSEISDSTYLTAYYDSKSAERHIIFQKDEKTIMDYNIDHGDTMVTNASPERAPAGMAAIFVPEVSRTYLYYVSKYQPNSTQAATYELWKAVRAQDQDMHGNWAWVWLQPVRVTPTTKLQQTTQLHVTARPERAENYITFTFPSGMLACVHDKWSTGFNS